MDHGAKNCHNQLKSTNYAGTNSASSKECPKWVLGKKVQAIKAMRHMHIRHVLTNTFVGYHALSSQGFQNTVC